MTHKTPEQLALVRIARIIETVRLRTISTEKHDRSLVHELTKEELLEIYELATGTKVIKLYDDENYQDPSARSRSR